MRKIGLTIAALAVTASAFAQGTFTIRRPVDGSTVRETVKVRIPKNSIPEGGYLGIYVNGNFVEAVLPLVDGPDYVYNLDTQGKKIADGPTKLEVALFIDNNGRQQKLDSSVVNLTIDNHTSIAVPPSGVKLRYKFVPGTERTYLLSTAQETSMVSQAQAQLGSRGVSQKTAGMNLRLLVGVDNAYTVNGQKQGLVRMQGLPDKGKDYATILLNGKTEPTQATADQLSKFYMRISDTGREVFGSVPVYFGIEGSNGAFSPIDYFPIIPLPILPSNAVKPGDAWRGTQLFGVVPDEELFMHDKFTQGLNCRGEFLGVTWYKGVPCAKIRTIVGADEKMLGNIKGLNDVDGETLKLEQEQLVYFALDRGAPIRIETSFTQESTVKVGTAGNQGGRTGAGAEGENDGAPGASGSGGPGGGPGRGRGTGNVGAGDLVTFPDGFDPSNFTFRPSYLDGKMSFFQFGGKGGGGGGRGGQNDEQGTRGNQGGGGIGRRGGGGGNAGAGQQKMILRLKASMVMEIER